MEDKNKNTDNKEKTEELQKADTRWNILANKYTVITGLLQNLTILGSILIPPLYAIFKNPTGVSYILYVLATIAAYIFLLRCIYKKISLRVEKEADERIRQAIDTQMHPEVEMRVQQELEAQIQKTLTDKQAEIEGTMQTLNAVAEKAKAEHLHSLCEVLHTYEHYIRDLICSGVAKTENAQTFYGSCTQICNLVVNAYNCLWGNKYKVSVCIKRLIAENDTEYQDWQLETIARSANTNIARINNENARKKPIFVKDNADFSIILQPDTPYTTFACNNLEDVNTILREKYANSEVTAYCNTTKNYLKYYKSTIVAPIRIALSESEVRAAFKTIYTHHVVGFLCIDTAEIFNDNDVLFDAGVDLARICADSMYKLFEDNIIYNRVSVDENDEK